MTLRINRVFLLGCYSVLMLSICSIGCRQRASSYKVSRVASPNGSLEAILTETNGGATASFGYEVSVGPRGAKKDERVASLYGAVRNAEAYGVNLSWADDHVLRVQYLQAKAVQNVLKTVDVNGQEVRVELQGGIEDASAPSGGMQ